MIGWLAALAVVPLGLTAPAAYSDPPVKPVAGAYNPEADSEVFDLYSAAGSLCAEARAMAADGIAELDIIESGAEVFTEDGTIVTVEGEMYLRGLLRGCLAADGDDW